MGRHDRLGLADGRARRVRGMGYGIRLVVLLVVASTAACTGQLSDGQREGKAQQPQAGPIYNGPAVHGRSNPLGMKWDWQRVDRYVPFLKRLSGGSTFFELVWCDVEREQGRRDWSRIDNVARSSQRLGYSLLLKIRVGSCWITGGQRGTLRGAQRKTASAMPLDLNTYQAFVRQVVQRYSAMGVHEYAIENEPNARKFFWDDTPEQYERLVTLGASAVRSVDAHARVLDGGVSSTAYGTAIAERLLAKGDDAAAVAAYQRYYARYVEQGYGGYPRVRNVGELRAVLAGEGVRRDLGLLAVTQRLVKNKVVDAFQLHFYESSDNVPALLAYLRETLPRGFPVQAWEVGMFWPGAPDNEQAIAGEMARTVVSLLGGGVRPVIWLPLAFNPAGGGTEVRFGLLDPDGRVRPAGDAMQRLATAAGQDASWRAVTTDIVSGVVFSRDGQRTVVLWSETGGVLPPPSQRGAKAEAIGGGTLPWAAPGLHIGRDPVVITMPGDLGDPLPLPG
jgi:hypothetical protein